MFGILTYVIMNRGHQIISKKLLTLQFQFGFELINSSSRYAQANGQEEKSNQTILDKIKKVVTKFGQPWHTNFQKNIRSYKTKR